MLNRCSEFGGAYDIDGYFPHLERSFGVGAFNPQGHRFSQYLAGITETAIEFDDYWTQLRGLVDGQGIAGPLDAVAGDAGCNTGDHIQRHITEQVERVERDQLHRDMLQLSRDDTRRTAWLAVDRLSSQWVPSWPTHRAELSQDE